MNRSYCVVDIEATGGNHKNGRIIEVGMVRVIDGNISDELSILINPEQPIDKYVSKLTGITDDDLVNAPLFEDVSEKIRSFLGDSIFVAHNATFDYTYLRSELRNVGIDYSADQLCTVDLSRKVFPDEESHSLGKLCRSLGLEVTNRHRALGDALSAALLLQRLIAEDNSGEIEASVMRRSSQLPADAVGSSLVSADVFSQLPDEPGIFHLKNQKGKIMYIGRGESIKSSLRRIFSNNRKFERFQRHQRSLYDINYELTGNELLAELIFYERVFAERPVLNVHMRQLEYRYCISIIKKAHKAKLAICRCQDKMGKNLAYFKDFKTAEKQLKALVKSHDLKVDQFDMNLQRRSKNNKGKTGAEELNELLKKEPFKGLMVKKKELMPNGRFLANGRKAYEKVLFVIEKGRFKGYRFVDMESTSDFDSESDETPLELLNIQHGERICWNFINQTNQYQKV